MTSELARAVADYLDTRRALGFKLIREERLLGQFAAFMDQAELSTITTDAALAWATGPVGADPNWWGSRLAVVRIFASWLRAFDPGLVHREREARALLAVELREVAARAKRVREDRLGEVGADQRLGVHEDPLFATSPS